MKLPLPLKIISGFLMTVAVFGPTLMFLTGDISFVRYILILIGIVVLTLFFMYLTFFIFLDGHSDNDVVNTPQPQNNGNYRFIGFVMFGLMYNIVQFSYLPFSLFSRIPNNLIEWTSVLVVDVPLFIYAVYHFVNKNN